MDSSPAVMSSIILRDKIGFVAWAKVLSVISFIATQLFISLLYGLLDFAIKIMIRF